MYLETLKVSRKTPGDGKLQISVTTFRAVEGAGAQLVAVMGSREAACGVSVLVCTCTRGEHGAEGAGPHRHYFVQSPLFHALTPDSSVRLDLDGLTLRLSITLSQP